MLSLLSEHWKKLKKLNERIYENYLQFSSFHHTEKYGFSLLLILIELNFSVFQGLSRSLSLFVFLSLSLYLFFICIIVFLFVFVFAFVLPGLSACSRVSPGT